MNSQDFLNNFRSIFDNPTSISSLKSLIIAMGVQGRLVEQDLSDKKSFEQVELAKKIKLQLVKKNKVKQERSLPKVDPSEINYITPSNWVLTRIGEILTVIRGASPRPKGDPKYFAKHRTEYHWVKISDINKYSDGWLLQDTDEFLTEEGAKHSVVLEKGTLVLTNSATIGLPIILNFDNGCIHDGYLAFPFLNPQVILQKFLYYYFLYFRKELEARAYGMAQINLNTRIVKLAPITLPPLSEQERIVTKIEELISFCSQLETQQPQSLEIQKKAVQQLLFNLTSVPNSKDRINAWQVLQNHFKSLFNISETVSSLKQGITQLGIEGKLKTQVNTDESAQDLLAQLTYEYREKLQTGDADKRRKSSVATEGEVTFSYPYYWRVVRLGYLVLTSGAGWSPQCDGMPRASNTDWGVLKISAVTWNKFLPEENKALPKDEKPRSDLEVQTGDFLISRANTSELVAKSVVVENTPPQLMISDKIVRLNFSELVEKRFYNLFNNSQFGRDYYALYATGTSSSMRNVSRQTILDMPVPLPPLNEQIEIVGKVTNLLSLCEDLDNLIRIFQSTKEELSVTLVKEILVINSYEKPTSSRRKKTIATKRIVTVLIRSVLHLQKDVSEAKLTKILKNNGGLMEAKELWQASGIKEVDDFYAVLNQEISDGFIQEPEAAELKLIEIEGDN